MIDVKTKARLIGVIDVHIDDGIAYLDRIAERCLYESVRQKEIDQDGLNVAHSIKVASLIISSGRDRLRDLINVSEDKEDKKVG